ncbi:MAG TPA: hypothetical protein VF731_01750 [Solirubrobacterales bacterium]
MAATEKEERRLGALRAALEEIRDKSFDPWAIRVANAALEQEKKRR